MMSSASGSATRQAMPSASWVLTGAFDHAAGGQRVGIGGGVAADHADDAHAGAPAPAWRRWPRRRPSPGRWARRPRRAAARRARIPTSRCHAAQQVGVEARHHVRAALSARCMACSRASWKSLAVLDQRDAQRAHGGVFLDRVAVRHDDGAGHAVAARGPAHALAVVAARGADHFARQRAAPGELVEIGQAAADLEGAHGRVVLVLEPAVGAQALAQQAPSGTAAWRRSRGRPPGRRLRFRGGRAGAS
jgi:hypothetical protein